MTLHLENDSESSTDIDNPGIFTGTTDNLLSFGREFFEISLGTFVGTMLAPHHREDPEFDEVRLTTEDLQDLFILL